MSTKKLLIATLASFVVSFLAGFIWYAALMEKFYISHSGSAQGVQKASPNMAMLIFGVLVIAFVMSYMFPKWTRGTYSLKEGLIYGALVGLITGLGVDAIQFATSNLFDSTALIVDSIYQVVEKGLMGAVIAMVYDKVKG